MSSIEELVRKEYEAHKNKYFGEDCFECEDTYNRATCNYAVGASITELDGTTIVLKTKKEAEEYGRKERESIGHCTVCQRFERILLQLQEKM